MFNRKLLAKLSRCACYCAERMTYLPAKDSLEGKAKVIYRSKDGRTSKTFKALDWMAQLVTHIPNKGLLLMADIFPRGRTGTATA